MRDAHLIREHVQRNFDDYRTTWATAGVLVLLAGAFAGGYATGRRAERLEGERMVASVQPPADAMGSATNSNRLTFYADLTKQAPSEPVEEAAEAPAKGAPPADDKPTSAKPDKPAGIDKAAVATRPSLINASDRVIGSVGDALAQGPALPGDYTVQVSSFQTREEARAFASALERKGFKPFVVSADLPGKGTWHRVRIGRFVNEEQARAAKGVLARSDIPSWVLRSD